MTTEQQVFEALNNATDNGYDMCQSSIMIADDVIQYQLLNMKTITLCFGV